MSDAAGRPALPPTPPGLASAPAGPTTGLVLPGGRSALAAADPVFVLCTGRSGSTLLRFLLDAHPDLACPPETRLAAMCAQMASVWSQLAGSPLPAERGSGPPPIAGAALTGIRQAMSQMIAPYLAGRGKRRYCDKSLGTAEHADVLRAVFPGVKFLCLYRHPMDVIASGIEACPWGLNGFGFDGYADRSPRNMVLALARYWADNVALIMAVEKRFPECSYRVRYEDLVADPEAVTDGIFRFLGVPHVPGLPEACFAAERERSGPSDYKIWHTSRIDPRSVGRGWSVPAGMIGPALTATINGLVDRLGYARIDAQWGVAATPPELRLPGSGPAATQRPAAGSGRAAPGVRLLLARLLSRLSGLDPRFTQRWQPCSTETFLVTVTSADAGRVAARWRVDLPNERVSSAAAAAGEAAGGRWEIAGAAEVWKQVIEREANLSVALRHRLLRYIDTDDGGALVFGNRMAMLSELLGITAWQSALPAPRPIHPGGAMPQTSAMHPTSVMRSNGGRHLKRSPRPDGAVPAQPPLRALPAAPARGRGAPGDRAVPGAHVVPNDQAGLGDQAGPSDRAGRGEQAGPGDRAGPSEQAGPGIQVVLADQALARQWAAVLDRAAAIRRAAVTEQAEVSPGAEVARRDEAGVARRAVTAPRAVVGPGAVPRQPAAADRSAGITAPQPAVAVSPSALPAGWGSAATPQPSKTITVVSTKNPAAANGGQADSPAPAGP
jgi:Sulfotransferase family